MREYRSAGVLGRLVYTLCETRTSADPTSAVVIDHLSFHRSWLIDFDSPVSDMGNFSERTFWIRTANPADSEAEPGTGDVTEREAHIRHFAMHPDWTRQGIGSALLAHCISYARSFGIRKLNCFSSLNAEPFYRAAGFETVRPMDLGLGPSLAFPAVLMRIQIA